MPAPDGSGWIGQHRGDRHHLLEFVSRSLVLTVPGQIKEERMKHVIWVLGLLLASMSATATPAQTIYTQEAPVLCTVATLQCHNIALTPGSGNSYTIGEPYSEFYAGAQFNLTLGGTLHAGHIEAVYTQFPAVGSSGAFSFSFSTQDGLTGTVSGQGHWLKPGKWWYAEIDSSTVTVN